MKKIYTFGAVLLVIIALVSFGVRLTFKNKTTSALADQQTNQPIECIDELEGKPVITSLSVVSGTIGTKVEINGCNFSGFEGDKNAWIKNDKGIAGILHGEEGSTSKLLRIDLKSPLCQKDVSYSGLSCDTWLTLVPGKYQIYVTPWGKESNKLGFTIEQSATTNTLITYYVLDKTNVNTTFCNGNEMDSAGFKAALSKKIVVTVPGVLTTEEKIKKTLSLAATANSFDETYARTAGIVYKNNTVAMGSADGWAGSSIFYCAWKPFVEKNLEQFSEVKKIIWDAFAEQSINQTVKVFFNNIIFDPGLTDCSKVYPVNRTIKPTSAVARAALEELLKGLAVGESDLGYLSNLNSGIKIQKLTIQNGVAKVDFSAKLEEQVGGSCRTAAIISQIKTTLKQFSTIQTVVISIDGRTEDILQP